MFRNLLVLIFAVALVICMANDSAASGVNERMIAAINRSASGCQALRKIPVMQVAQARAPYYDHHSSASGREHCHRRILDRRVTTSGSAAMLKRPCRWLGGEDREKNPPTTTDAGC
jgi:hypothetical protein